jgi:hypothetical protein
VSGQGNSFDKENAFVGARYILPALIPLFISNSQVRLENVYNEMELRGVNPMATMETSTLFDEILDFLASTPTPEQIVEFHPSARLQLRLQHLLDRNRDETLTAEESAELDEFSRMNHLMSMLKIRARKRLLAT